MAKASYASLVPQVKVFVALIAGVWLADYSHLDFWLEQQFFNHQTQVFAWRHHWLLDTLLHHSLKNLMYLLGFFSILLAIYAVRKKWISIHQAIWGAGGILLLPLLITGLKRITAKQCPWSIDGLGGASPYVHLLDNSLESLGSQCFPAGHAAGGYMWLAWAATLAVSHPLLARVILWFGLLMGSLMGLARMMQGAHFLSHVIASAAICWAYMLTVQTIFNRRVGYLE